MKQLLGNSLPSAKQTSLTFLFLVVIALVIVLSGCASRPDPVETVKEFVLNLNAYNAKGCIELLAPNLRSSAESSMTL